MVTSGLLRGDSPARTSAQQGVELDSEEVGRFYGMKCIGSLGSCVPGSSLPKTSDNSATEDLTECYRRLPRSGMLLNGKLFQQAQLELLIEGRGFGLLPTPSVSDATHHYRNIRAKETWEKCGRLTNRMKGLCLGLTGKERAPAGKYMANPWLAEWMMGYPLGWTE